MSESRVKELTYSQFIYESSFFDGGNNTNQELNDRFDKAQTSEQAIEIIKEWNEIRIDYRTNTSLIGTNSAKMSKMNGLKTKKTILMKLVPLSRKLRQTL